MQSLAEFLKRNDISQTDFARMIGVTPGRVHQLLHPDRRDCPSLEIVEKIERLTSGAVTLADWSKRRTDPTPSIEEHAG